MSTPATTEPMKTNERRALEKIVKQRVKLLVEQMQHRKQEIREAVRDLIIEEHETARKAAVVEAKQIVAEAKKMQLRVDKLLRQAGEKGLVPGMVSSKVQSSWMNRRQGYEHVTTIVTEANGFLSVSWADPTQWVPADIDNKIEDALTKVEHQAGLSRLQLAQLENDLLEELLVGELQSADAKKFLDRLPSLDALPSPRELKQLMA